MGARRLISIKEGIRRMKTANVPADKIREMIDKRKGMNSHAELLNAMRALARQYSGDDAAKMMAEDEKEDKD